MELGQVEGEIQLKGVHFAYPTRKDVRVLTGLTLSIKRGQIVALVGRSGGFLVS